MISRDPILAEQPKPIKEQPDIDIASNEPKHSHGFALLMRSPRSDLFTGTMATDNTDYGGRKKNYE